MYTLHVKTPKLRQGDSKSEKIELQCGEKGAQEHQKRVKRELPGAKGNQKGAKREPKGCQREVKGEPKGNQNASKNRSLEKVAKREPTRGSHALSLGAFWEPFSIKNQ